MSNSNTERYIQESRQHKKEFLALSGSYSNYLHKSLERFTNSLDGGVDAALVSRITQIHEDKDKIEHQHATLLDTHGKLMKLSEKLESQVAKSSRYLVKNNLVAIDPQDHHMTNLLQKKSELIDQDIRILEHCVQLLQNNS